MNLRLLLDIFFPPQCVRCGCALKEDDAICAHCLGTIALHDALFCGKCSARLPEGTRVCHAGFPYLLGSAGDYQNDALKSLILGLKFEHVTSAAKPLGDLIVRYAELLPVVLRGRIVIPIPLSARRERERGFNQAALIAERFADHFALSYSADILSRPKHTAPQSELGNFARRRENVKGCFSVAEPWRVAGARIILIDDVSTSGATFLEAATALRKAGAKQILAFAAAKA